MPLHLVTIERNVNPSPETLPRVEFMKKRQNNIISRLDIAERASATIFVDNAGNCCCSIKPSDAEVKLNSRYWEIQLLSLAKSRFNMEKSFACETFNGS